MMTSCSKPKWEDTTGPNWLELPREVTANVLQRLDTVEIVTSACLVCPLWWNICKDPLMWRTIHMSNFAFSPYDLEMICRYAIERSCGHVEDIGIKYLRTEGLLKCIAYRGSNLRRLAICGEISNKGLSEAVKNLTLLEELDLSSFNISKDTLEVIGRCCPFLKSLKFRLIVNKVVKWDGVAFAIAKTKPKLCYLKISGTLFITNAGLLAILDGCPLLETLDLQVCLYLELISGSLEKRCRKQIKDLRLPNRYAADYDSLAYVEPFKVTYANDDREY